MMQHDKRPSGGHLLIAGTGRAGTSFLVRWLSELGLDTQLSRDGEQAAWDENANAGLETVPVDDGEHDLPYVIKFPWLYQCIDHVLARGYPRIDAVIVPVRDLADAAASRTIVELQAMHEQMPWIDQMDQSWEVWGKTPGGVAFSLNPIDQGRILAVGFHHLIQRLVQAEIPVVLLAYPRLVEDWRHLFERLRRFLPAGVDEQAAEQAHRNISDPGKVRVETELGGSPGSEPIARYPAFAQLDALAIRRELLRAGKDMTAAIEAARLSRIAQQQAEAVRDAALNETIQWREALNGANMRAGTAEWAAYQERAAAQKMAEEAKAANRRAVEATQQATEATREATEARREATEARQEATEARQQSAVTAQQLDSAIQDLHKLKLEVEHGRQEAARLNSALSAALLDAGNLRDQMAAIYASRSWRLTRPYRGAYLTIKRLTGH